MNKRTTPVPAKKFTKNIIKGIVTSIFGIATMIITLFLWWTGSMDFIWGGIAGLAMGTILLLAPDTIVEKLGDVIKAVGLNKSGAEANIQEVQQIEDKEKEEKTDDPTNTRKD